MVVGPAGGSGERVPIHVFQSGMTKNKPSKKTRDEGDCRRSRQQTSKPAGEKPGDVNGTRLLKFFGEILTNDEAADNEEHIDTDETAGQKRWKRVEDQHQDNRETTQPIDIGAKWIAIQNWYI